MESLKDTFNDNDKYINTSLNNDKNNDIDPSKVDDIALRLEETFDPGAAPKLSKSWQFYCKVALKLDQSTIDRLITQAKEKGRGNGGPLFNYLASKEMRGNRWKSKK